MLKDLRENKNLTQVQIAQKLGVNVQNISNIERGKAPIPAHHVKKLAKTLGVSKEKIINIAVESFRKRYAKRV